MKLNLWMWICIRVSQMNIKRSKECPFAIVIKNGEIAADGITTEILVNTELMEECGLEVRLALQNCPVCGIKKQEQILG